MTRDEVLENILNIKNSNILCELPTSFGKTKIALSLLKERLPLTTNLSILIVIPRLVLIENWKDEFKKWNMENYLNNVEFVTYVSFPKKAGNWDLVIFDEVHHLSARCRESLEFFNIKNNFLLSATVGRDMKKELLYYFKDLYIYKVSTKKAIEAEILPDPKVFLIPLNLDNRKPCCQIIKNNKMKDSIIINYKEKWNYLKVKNKKIIINCTQRQYYNDMTASITWCKRRLYNETFKNLFLRKSGERLKWLSDQKTSFVKDLLNNYLKGTRTLTFCNSINQTEVLGKYCINSKNKNSEDNLNSFNKHRINHITACNMLNEGINLNDCRVGIYASLNSSERMIKQKLGRLLRHPDPIIIIPYFINTRDRELIDKMLEDYNPDLVTRITDLTQFKTLLKNA